MLKSVEIKNLTVFPKAKLEFSPGLNVFIGENGTGKTHLLKILYTVLAVSATEGQKNVSFHLHKGRSPNLDDYPDDLNH